MSRNRTQTAASIGALVGRTTLSVAEAGEVLGLGRSAAYEAVRRGDIPSRRIGRRIVVPAPALLRWLGGGLDS
jgi:excisionase family DNA binding protein